MKSSKISKINVKRVLKNAPEAKVFRTADGKKLYNIHELLEALKTMSEDVFHQHVNAKKNDFIPWVKLVLGDRKLGRKLRWTTTRETSIKKIKDHLDAHYI
jgi:hypothetical protein